jgi:hypothetical protein
MLLVLSVEGVGDVLFTEFFCEISVVVPLQEVRLAVDVVFQLLEERFAAFCTLQSCEFAFHVLEELLLVNVAVQVPESFLAFVIPGPRQILVHLQHATMEYSP